MSLPISLVKPKILGDLSDIVAPRNSNVQVKCESVGVPPPTTVWQKLSSSGKIAASWPIIIGLIIISGNTKPLIKIKVFKQNFLLHRLGGKGISF